MKALEKPWTPEEGEAYELHTVGSVGVKIYRRERLKPKRRWVYEMVDHTTGSRRLRSFSKLPKARKAAKGVAKLLASGQAAAAAMLNTDAASYGRAVELLRPTGLSLELAASIVAKGIEILGANRVIEACEYFKLHEADTISPKSTAEVVTALVAKRKADGKSGRYVADLRARLNRFANENAVDIHTISTATIQAWLDGLNLSPRSTKNFRGALSTLFKFAAARGYISRASNPVKDTERVEANGEGAIEIYTPQEISKLLTHATDAFLPYLAIGAFSGLRSAEIERLEWKEIDRASGYITVSAKKAKTRSRRLVPITANLGQWLDGCADQTGKVWKGSERDLLDARAQTVSASGVPWKHNALRHSFISYRLAEIQDVDQTAIEAGNSATMIFSNYRELVKPQDAKAYFGIAPKKAPGSTVIQLKTAAAGH